MTAQVGQPGADEARRPRTRIRIPLWRRITALFSLAFVSVMVGVALAVVVGGTALFLLFLLERAIAT